MREQKSPLDTDACGKIFWDTGKIDLWETSKLIHEQWMTRWEPSDFPGSGDPFNLAQER